MMFGWTGSLLDVDLSTGQSCTHSVPGRLFETLLGGANLGAYFLLNLEVFAHHPLDPENSLLFLTGPLSGTNFPGAGRTHVMARSPLTGLVGESSLGGYFATPLKLSGYDILLIRGRSKIPVLLEIDGYENRVSIQPAERLWGLDTYQADQALRDQYPGKAIHTVCIGPAGEHLVPMASLVHDRHFIAARTGMGAVMGSKKLKAIVAFARGKVELSDPQAYRTLRSEAVGILQEDYWAQRRKELGTVGNLQWAIETERAPTKNWLNVEWVEGARAITGETLAQEYLVGNRTCQGCPIVCKRVVEVDHGPYTVEKGPGPEYETGIALGAMLLNESLVGLLKANELCNRLGLDSISVGGTLAWALEAYQKGFLKESDLDGRPLHWGDVDRILGIIRQVGLQEGDAGKLLGMGSARASQAIAMGSEDLAIHVKGLEVAYHHPRVARGMEITYATNPRGAAHTESPNLFGHEQASYAEWVRQIALTTDQSVLPNAYILCMFNTNTLGVPFMAKVINAVTGERWDEEQLTHAAERGWYLKRIFNFYCGAGLEKDGLPKRIQEQIKDAGVDHPDFNHALELYWRYRQLDPQGFPLAEKLTALGLEQFSRVIEVK